MLNSHTTLARAALLLAVILLTGCSSLSPAAQPTQDMNALKTSVVQTLHAQFTQTAEALPTATPTLEPTATLAPTPTLEATPMPLPTLAPTSAQPAVPTAQPTAGTYSGDHAVFQYQVPGDGATFAKGEVFHVAWGVKNDGTTTWNTNYAWVFLGGTQVSGVTVAKLTKEVKPGEKYEFFYEGTAPNKPGSYKTSFKLVNDQGGYIFEVYFSFNVAP